MVNNFGIGYTGFTVGKKIKATNKVEKYYYNKCRTEGYNCNKNITGLLTKTCLLFWMLQHKILSNTPTALPQKYSFDCD